MNIHGFCKTHKYCGQDGNHKGLNTVQPQTVHILGKAVDEGDLHRKGYGAADQKQVADVDAAIVGTHIMMEIEQLGLATTWVAYFDVDKFKALFPESKDWDVIALFPIGHKAPEARPAHLHAKRRDRSELVIEK